VGVVGHQAVRQKCKLLALSSVPKMRQRSIHGGVGDENSLTVERANRQEVFSTADIRVAIESAEPRHDAADKRQWQCRECRG
jgi:hypothetical protein